MKFLALLLIVLLLLVPDLSRGQSSGSEEGSANETDARLQARLVEAAALMDQVAPGHRGAESDIQKITRIVELLEAAAKLVPETGRKNYFQALAEATKTGDFSKSNLFWGRQENHRVDMVFYQSKPQKKRKGATTLAVFALNTESMTRLARLQSVEDKLRTNTVLKKQASLVARSLDFSEFFIADLVPPVLISNPVLVHPPRLSPDENGYKVLLFRNMIQDHFDRRMVKISKLLFPPSLQTFVEFDAYFLHFLLHHMAHGWGPFLVEASQDNPITVEKRLKKYFYTVEEIKADTAAACALPTLIKEKILDPRVEKKVLCTYVLHLLTFVSSGDTGRQTEPCVAQLNFLLENEGIVYDIEKSAILIDFSRMKGVVERLLERVIKIETGANLQDAKRLVEAYSKSSSVIQRIRDITKPFWIEEKTHGGTVSE